jgi:hypothetical protein
MSARSSIQPYVVPVGALPAEYGRLRQLLSAGLSASSFPLCTAFVAGLDGWDVQNGVLVLRANHRRRTLLRVPARLPSSTRSRSLRRARRGPAGEASALDERGFLALEAAGAGVVSGNLKWEDCSCATVGLAGQLVNPGRTGERDSGRRWLAGGLAYRPAEGAGGRDGWPSPGGPGPGPAAVSPWSSRVCRTRRAAWAPMR